MPANRLSHRHCPWRIVWRGVEHARWSRKDGTLRQSVRQEFKRALPPGGWSRHDTPCAERFNKRLPEYRAWASCAGNGGPGGRGRRPAWARRPSCSLRGRPRRRRSGGKRQMRGSSWSVRLRGVPWRSRGLGVRGEDGASLVVGLCVRNSFRNPVRNGERKGRANPQGALDPYTASHELY